MKSLLNASLREPAEAALRREADLQRALFGTPNQREAVIANLHKREPRFEDPQGALDPELARNSGTGSEV